MRAKSELNRLEVPNSAMPITISTIDHERHELDVVASGAIHYIDVERHLVEERNVGGIA